MSTPQDTSKTIKDDKKTPIVQLSSNHSFSPQEQPKMLKTNEKRHLALYGAIGALAIAVFAIPVLASMFFTTKTTERANAALNYQFYTSADQAICGAPGADTDGDGILNYKETSHDTDGDNTPNCLDTDSNGDGVADSTQGTAPGANGRPAYLNRVRPIQVDVSSSSSTSTTSVATSSVTTTSSVSSSFSSSSISNPFSAAASNAVTCEAIGAIVTDQTLCCTKTAIFDNAKGYVCSSLPDPNCVPDWANTNDVRKCCAQKGGTSTAPRPGETLMFTCAGLIPIN
jgi:hypothetical protein